MGVNMVKGRLPEKCMISSHLGKMNDDNRPNSSDFPLSDQSTWKFLVNEWYLAAIWIIIYWLRRWCFERSSFQSGRYRVTTAIKNTTWDIRSIMENSDQQANTVSDCVMHHCLTYLQDRLSLRKRQQVHQCPRHHITPMDPRAWTTCSHEWQRHFRALDLPCVAQFTWRRELSCNNMVLSDSSTFEFVTSIVLAFGDAEYMGILISDIYANRDEKYTIGWKGLGRAIIAAKSSRWVILICQALELSAEMIITSLR